MSTTITPRAQLLYFAISCFALASMASQAGMPSPLFPLYVDEWGFSQLQVSCVFAAYIVGVSATLLTTGSLSDYIGRKPVLLISLACAVAAMAIFLLADSLAWVLVARVLQGMSLGTGYATGGAALLDFSPPHRHGLVNMINGAMPAIFMGLGALSTGVMLQIWGQPFVIPFAAYLVMLIAVLIALLFVRDTLERAPGALRTLKPSLTIPTGAGATFTVAATAVAASWGLMGLYLGTGPTITRDLLGIDSPIMAGVAILAVAGFGGITTVVTKSAPTPAVLRLGTAALVAASAGIVVAVLAERASVFFIASLIGGIGFGAAFQSGLRMIMEGLAERQRSGTLATLYLISYAAFGLPSLVAGALIPHVGLMAVVAGYAALVAFLAVVPAILGRRNSVILGTQ